MHDSVVFGEGPVGLFLSEARAWPRVRGPWDPNLLGNPLERGGGGASLSLGCSFPSVAGMSRPGSLFMKEMEHLSLCLVLLGW